MAAAPYDDLRRVLSEDPEDRRLTDLEQLEEIFRKRAKVFERLPRETLLELMKQCQFRRVEKGDIISQHGESSSGDSFFIILRGKVSVQLMPTIDVEDTEDVTSGEDVVESDTSKIGTVINTLGDGDTFGEIGLLAEDCVQNAAYVAEDETDLVILKKHLYKNSLSDFIDPDFQDRLAFVESYPLFSTWPNKWKKYLAASLRHQQHGFEEVLVRQGDKADYMYFIVSGEVSVLVDPAAHEEQFAEFKSKCSHLVDETNAACGNAKNFSMTNWLSAKSRVADRLNSAHRCGNDVTDRTFSENLPEYQVKLSPSAVRRNTARSRRRPRKINLCYLSKGNIIGDVEFLLDMDVYHVTVTCTQQTVTMSLHRAVYDRIFRKKNPDTFKQMCRNLDRQIPIRYSRRQVVDCVPLIPYIIAKIQDVNGVVKATRDADDTESLPFLDSASHAGSRSSRAKSIISSRSFPMTHRREQRLLVTPNPVLPSVDDQLTSSGYLPSPRAGTAARRSGELSATGASVGFPDTPSSVADGRDRSNPDSGSRNPRDGIFIKLLQIANPMVNRRHLNVDEDEYRYLLQLRRRMARKIEDFYPTASVSVSQIPGAGGGRARGRSSRATTARISNLPMVPGVGRASPHKTAMKRKSAKSRPNTRQKTVFFLLP